MKIINTSDINQARKEIQQFKKSKLSIIIQAQGDDFNRKILENKDIDILISPELHQRKDKLKQRDSGLNEVLCKLAKKNDVKIAIDLKQIQKLSKQDKAIALARIMQNIKLCKRTKTHLVILSKGKFKKQDISSLFLTLKASTQQAKEAFDFN